MNLNLSSESLNASTGAYIDFIYYLFVTAVGVKESHFIKEKKKKQSHVFRFPSRFVPAVEKKPPTTNRDLPTATGTTSIRRYRSRTISPPT